MKIGKSLQKNRDFPTDKEKFPYYICSVSHF